MSRVSAMLGATGQWSFRAVNQTGECIDIKPMDVAGRDAEDMLHILWERCHIDQPWDQELIRHGLSCSPKYTHLTFGDMHSDRLYLSITTEIALRELLFPKVPATLQDCPPRKRKVHYERYENGEIELEREFGYSELFSQREENPEMVALYHSESFTRHMQYCNGVNGDYKIFTVKKNNQQEEECQ